MSQTAVFVYDLHSENQVTGICSFVLGDYVLSSVPDQDVLWGLAKDEDISGFVKARYVWYEIGEGESSTDDFFTDEQLLAMWQSDDFEEACDVKGFTAEQVESGSVCTYVQGEDEED